MNAAEKRRARSERLAKAIEGALGTDDETVLAWVREIRSIGNS